MRLKIAAIFAVLLCAAGFSQASAQTTVFASPFVANSSGNAGFSYAQSAPSISAGGDHVRVTFNSTSGGTHAASHVSICIQASRYGCASAPVELTFGGAYGFSIPANGAALASDFVPLVTAPGQTLLVKEDVASDSMPRNSAGPVGWDSWPNMGSYWNVAVPPSGWWGFSSTYGFSGVDVETAALPPSSLPPTPPPASSFNGPGISGGGRLTLVHGQSRMTQDAAAAFVDYAPDVGVTVPVIDGAGAVHQAQFTASTSDAVGQTLPIDATWQANGMFDIYEAWNGGVPALCSGPVWSSNAQPVPDTFFAGIRVNGATFTCRLNPANSVSCPVDQCTHLGMILISQAAGVVRCDFTSGEARECGVWNIANRIRGVLRVTNPTATPFAHELAGGTNPNQFQPPPADMRLAGDPNLFGLIISGPGGDRPSVTLSVNHRALHDNSQSNPNTAYMVSIGWNSLSTPCGDLSVLNNYARDSLGPNGWSNYEFYGGNKNDNVVYASTQHAWCEPLAFQGAAAAYALEWQEWFYGEEWIDSGDVMMKIDFTW